MHDSPAPFVFRLLLVCLGFALATVFPLNAAEEEPLKPGDLIDVTLQTGAVYEYARVIDVRRDSIIVANPQGVREFEARHLTPDLQARLPGAAPRVVAPPPAPEPPPVAAAPAPVAPTAAPVDLEALAAAISARIDAQAKQPDALPPSPPAPQPAPAGGLVNALAIGLLLIVPTLNVLATRSAILRATGAAVPMWILAIWLLPLVGSLSAFAALSGGGTPPAKTA